MLCSLLLAPRVTYLVLDEADRMLDKGFENDIRQIIARTANGKLRQTLMCEPSISFAELLIRHNNGSRSQCYLARLGQGFGSVLPRGSNSYRGRIGRTQREWPSRTR